MLFFFSSRRRHTRSLRDWSSDVCSSDLIRARRLRVVKAATLECFSLKICGDHLRQLLLPRRGEASVIPGPLVLRSALSHESKPDAFVTGRLHAAALW